MKCTNLEVKTQGFCPVQFKRVCFFRRFILLLILLLNCEVAFASFKVLTLNFWAVRVPFPVRSIPLSKRIRERSVLALQEIQSLDPEIICLQEIWGRSDRAFWETELRRQGYHVVVSESQALKQSDGESEDRLSGEKELRFGNGLIIATKSPPLLAPQTLRFSRATLREENFVSKGALATVVEAPGYGPIWVINTHLGAVKWNQKKGVPWAIDPKVLRRQQMQLQELLNWSASFLGPSLLTGDFNSHPLSFKNGSYQPGVLSDGYKLLLNSQWIDSHSDEEVNLLPTFDTRSNSWARQGVARREPPSRLDYLWIRDLSPRGAIEFHRAFDQMVRFSDGSPGHLSDHYGLITEFP